jgi:putative flavoprotein involved in K+ transport
MTSEPDRPLPFPFPFRRKVQTMNKTDVLIVGGGQAGMALSRCLTDERIDHVVIERGRIAERWRSETPDSLRLLSPNWMTRLPGWRYTGADPDGFMTKHELVDFLERYAASFGAPVLDDTTVLDARLAGGEFVVETDRGSWRSRALVVATGQCAHGNIPLAASRIGGSIAQLHSSAYRSPASVPHGKVLVVGASSSGVQIADELRQAGRDVVISVGGHIRMPRTWRGRDIFWWLDRSGLLSQRVEDLPARSHRQPSMQLVGRPDRSDIDLATLVAGGVRLAGRFAGIESGVFRFADDLAQTTAHADEKLFSLLDRFDALGPGGEDGARPAPFQAPPGVQTLSRRDGIGAVVWATGFSRSYGWLRVPVLRRDGEIDHRGGATAVPGLHVLGLRMLKRRNSNFIDGVGADALELSRQLATHLAATRRQAA